MSEPAFQSENSTFFELFWEGCQVIGLRCDDAIGVLKNPLDLGRRIVIMVCSSPSCCDD